MRSVRELSWLSAFAVAILLFNDFQVLADSADDWARMKPIVPRGYVCYRAEKPPEIDGRLDDASWQAVPWTDDFADIEGDRRPRPRFRTRTKMLWDDSNFYVGAEMEEPHVWGTLTKRDSVIFHDNDFEIFIDPDGDNHEYYEFEINALNTGWDLFLPRPYKDGGRAEDRWDFAGLRTAVHVAGTLNDPTDRDKSWSVEIAIPWGALREYARRAAPPRDGDQWRVNFSRVEWEHQVEGGKYVKVADRREDNWVWSPQGIIDMHRPERWGFVKFSMAAPGSVRWAPDASLRARETLLEVYHLQKAIREKKGCWAATLEDLGLTQETLKDVAGPLELKATPNGFRASVPTPFDDGRTQVLTIRQDSMLRVRSDDDDLTDTIEAILSEQATAWNAGDVDEFMKHYWKSDDLTFSSGGRTTRGWETTKDNYKQRYPTKERMGNLSFGAIEVAPLGESAALVLGRWSLQRDPAPIGGNFSLVFRRIDGAWLIVHDHTSHEKPAEPRE